MSDQGPKEPMNLGLQQDTKKSRKCTGGFGKEKGMPRTVRWRRRGFLGIGCGQGQCEKGTFLSVKAEIWDPVHPMCNQFQLSCTDPIHHESASKGRLSACRRSRLSRWYAKLTVQ